MRDKLANLIVGITAQGLEHAEGRSARSFNVFAVTALAFRKYLLRGCVDAHTVVCKAWCSPAENVSWPSILVYCCLTYKTKCHEVELSITSRVSEEANGFSVIMWTLDLSIFVIGHS